MTILRRLIDRHVPLMPGDLSTLDRLDGRTDPHTTAAQRRGITEGVRTP